MTNNYNELKWNSCPLSKMSAFMHVPEKQEIDGYYTKRDKGKVSFEVLPHAMKQRAPESQYQGGSATMGHPVNCS